MQLADVVEELTNHGDEHQPRSEHFFTNSQRLFANSNQLFTNNDVQSMDAIERRDFINEQEATANCILGTSSLIINGTNGDEPRLNLDLLGNSFSQKMEQIAATLNDDQTTKRNAEHTNSTENGEQSVINGSDQLITTPTTSRTKRSRMPFPGEKSALAKSLEKSNDADKESTSDRDTTHRKSPDSKNSAALFNILDHSDGCNCANNINEQQSTSKSIKCLVCDKKSFGDVKNDDVSKADDLDDDDDLDDEHGDNDDVDETGESSMSRKFKLIYRNFQ